MECSEQTTTVNDCRNIAVTLTTHVVGVWWPSPSAGRRTAESGMLTSVSDQAMGTDLILT
jgi:hypothetical protein